MAKRLTWCVLGFVVLVTATVSMAGVKEHPLIRPFPGSTLNEKSCEYKDFDAYTFRVQDPETGREKKITVKGKFWKLMYTLYKPDGNWDKSHSTLAYIENYKGAALKNGGTILYEKGSHLVFTLPADDGGKTWVHVRIANSAQQIIRVIQEAPMEQQLVFGPAEMKKALDADGRVMLHGILFDTDRATLKADSAKQLQHVLKLLIDYPALKLEVQGHTDDQGSDEHNLELSRQRAETVVAYLALFGIDRERLEPKGYGESRPVAPNTTEAGRSQNRRVELVKLR